MNRTDDRAWLLAKLPYASQNQQEYFIEKVGKLMDDGLNESMARANALKQMRYAGVT